MKRFFSILMCIILVSACFIMPLSIHAEDVDLPLWDGTDLNGTTWKVPYNWECTSAYGKYYLTGSISVGQSIFDLSTSQYNLYIGYEYSYNEKSNIITASVGSSLLLKNNATFYISITGGRDSTNTSLIEWLKSYGEITSHSMPKCDGSSCPANDANLDGICDDCGAPMTMSLRSPTLESLKAEHEYYHYIVYHTVDSDTGEYIDTRLSFISSLYPMELTSSYWDRLNDDAWGVLEFRFENEGYVNGVNYISNDGGTTWVRSTTFSNGTTLFNVDENIVSSTFDIYDEETGELFFPLPLWETVETVTQGTLPELEATLGGNLMTLTLCGVGLLILLMGLYLLYKTLSTCLR